MIWQTNVNKLFTMERSRAAREIQTLKEHKPVDANFIGIMRGEIMDKTLMLHTKNAIKNENKPIDLFTNTIYSIAVSLE